MIVAQDSILRYLAPQQNKDSVILNARRFDDG